MADIAARLTKLEERVAENEKDIEGHGSTLDQLTNTIDSIILPTQKSQGESIARHENVTQEAVVFMATQRGAWLFIQRAGVVIAAVASAAGLVIKLLEYWQKLHP